MREARTKRRKTCPFCKTKRKFALHPDGEIRIEDHTRKVDGMRFEQKCYGSGSIVKQE